MVGRKGQALQALGRLDDGGGQAHLDVPLDMAVEQPRAWVGGPEAQHSERVCHDGHRVALHRRAGVVDVAVRPAARPAAGAIKHLEVMAVQVEGVRGRVEVVDHDLDEIAVGDDEGVDLAVDDWVGVEVAGCSSGVQGGYLLGDVCDIVEVSAVAKVSV